MRYQSPLGNLRDVLIQIQESADLYKTTLSKNEAATRTVLIDPVLRALGWNTANTNMVEVEKTMDSVRADYALYDINQIPQIIIEAKSLGTDLDQKKLIMALVNYAFNFGLEDIFLTDGLVWEHFDKFLPGKVEPTRVINIAKDDIVDCAAYFVQHLDAAKYWPIEQSIDVLSQRIEELENTVTLLQKTINEHINKPPIDYNDKYGNSELSNFVLLSELDDTTGKKPIQYQLPDGRIIDIKNWRDILRESCHFVLDNNNEISIPFPDRVGKKVSLFSYEKPPKGIGFVTREYKGKTIYFYLNYDSNNCIANSIYIIKFAPKSKLTQQPRVKLE